MHISKSDVYVTNLETNERIFFTKIAYEGNMSTKELQDWAKKLDLLSPRRTITLLQDMKKKGMIKQAKVKGYKKRWVINEEEFGDFIDVWVTFEKNGKKERIQLTQSKVCKSSKGFNSSK